MLLKNWEKKLLWSSVGLIVSLSYFFFSSRYYPLLSSDDALNVLMTHYYQLPKDIYCWGQNRGGTIIPLIAQVFYKGLHFSEINAVSLSNYFLLLIGFLGFSSLFQNRFTKVIFAVFWFLPPIWFIDSLRFPYGVQYCLIGAIILIMKKLEIDPEKKLSVYQHISIAMIIVLSTATVWVSDLAVVSIFALFFALVFFRFVKGKFRDLQRIYVFYFLLGFIVCIGFIWYAKATTTGIQKQEYLGLNSFAEAIKGFVVTGNTILDFLFFRTDKPFMSIYVYLIFLLTGYVFANFYFKKIQISANMKRWFFFFVLDGILVFCVILFSFWAATDGYGRRFFICSYISFGLALFILADRLIIENNNRTLKAILIVTVLVGSLSTFHYLKFVEPKSFTPKVEIVKEFEKLSRCGIIAEYWNAYIFSCTNPELIKAIPHENNSSRNSEIEKDVFKGRDIYLIKDDWLENFPDTIGQYWHLMVKDGKEFTLAGKTLCRYKKIN